MDVAQARALLSKLDRLAANPGTPAEGEVARAKAAEIRRRFPALGATPALEDDASPISGYDPVAFEAAMQAFREIKWDQVAQDFNTAWDEFRQAVYKSTEQLRADIDAAKQRRGTTP